jgi:hypothetical protein
MSGLDDWSIRNQEAGTRLRCAPRAVETTFKGDAQPRSDRGVAKRELESPSRLRCLLIWYERRVGIHEVLLDLVSIWVLWTVIPRVGSVRAQRGSPRTSGSIKDPTSVDGGSTLCGRGVSKPWACRPQRSCFAARRLIHRAIILVLFNRLNTFALSDGSS